MQHTELKLLVGFLREVLRSSTRDADKLGKTYGNSIFGVVTAFMTFIVRTGTYFPFTKWFLSQALQPEPCILLMLIDLRVASPFSYYRFTLLSK